MEPHDMTAAFTAWAAVVALMGGAIVWELARLRGELKTMTEQLNDYIVNMERRVTAIETHMTIKHGYENRHTERYSENHR